MCTQTPREMPSGAAGATRFSCLRLFLLTSSAPLNARRAGSTGYTTREERSPPVTAQIHTVHICSVLSLQCRWRDENELHPHTQPVRQLCCGRGGGLEQELELRGAHHLAVALIQLPLRSYASSHSHTACAFSAYMIRGVFFRLCKMHEATLCGWTAAGHKSKCAANRRSLDFVVHTIVIR